MENHDTNPGEELLFLLRQHRYLYHQLKLLTDKQLQLAKTDSPELLLEIVSGRHKLVEKLRQLNEKLRLIKANWNKLSEQIGPEYRMEAQKTANQVREIIDQILASVPSKTAPELSLCQDWKFDQLFAATQH